MTYNFSARAQIDAYGRSLRANRIARGMTIEELSIASGIGRGAISGYERGLFASSEATKRRLAQAIAGGLPSDLQRRRRHGPERNRKTPSWVAQDRVVAIALVAGEVSHQSLVAAGMKYKRADKWLQATLKAGRIYRWLNGVYRATADEYARLGLTAPPDFATRTFPAEEIIRRMETTRANTTQGAAAICRSAAQTLGEAKQ